MTKAKLYNEFWAKSSRRKRSKASTKTRTTFQTHSFSTKNNVFSSSFPATALLSFKCSKNSSSSPNLKNGFKNTSHKASSSLASFSFSTKCASWVKNSTFTHITLSNSSTIRDLLKFPNFCRLIWSKNNLRGFSMIIVTWGITSCLKGIATRRNGWIKSWMSSGTKSSNPFSWM